MNISRGDIVLAAAPGDYGKPRPVLVVQSNFFNPSHASIVVCLITSDLKDAELFRLDIKPNAENGLRIDSQIMIDKPIAIKRERVREKVGTIDDTLVQQVNRSLALFLGLADIAGGV